MLSFCSRLLAGVALALLVPSASDAQPAPGTIQLAEAQTGAVADAEKAVADARAKLRKAMATGQGIKEARTALAEAEKALDQARLSATTGGAPADATAGGTPADAAAPAVKTAPAEPPAAAVAAPPSPDTAATPPVAAAPVTTPDSGTAAPGAPPAEAPPAAAANEPPATPGATPPADTGAPADVQPTGKLPKKHKPPIGATEDAGKAPPPAADAPAAGAEAPAATAAPGEAAAPPAGAGGAPAAGAAGEPAAEGAQPVVELAPGQAPPPPVVAATPPPPPPAVVKPGNRKETGGANPAAGAAPPQAAAAPIKPVGIGEKAADGRVVLRENGQLVIKHDENRRFEASGGRVFEQAGANGHRIITINRPDGSQIVTERDGDGNIIRRTRKLPNGQVVVIIDAKPVDKGKIAAGIDYLRRLPPVVLNIPVQQYVVESQQATPQVIEQTLIAPPVEQVERPYSLEEIRQSGRLRDKVRRIDVDTVNFEFGQATLAEDQVAQLDEIGKALAAVVSRKPDEVFLVEGHTDAVGSDLSNLALSDRRAESVAEILTYYYKVPPENLVTQGYGEQYLKVPTEGPERENRRVTIRRITPLLKGAANN